MQFANRVMSSAASRAFAGNGEVDFVLAAIDSVQAAGAGVPQMERQARMSRVTMLGSVGRSREAEAVVAELRTQSGDLAMNATIFLIITGVAPADVFAPERALLSTYSDNPGAAYWQALNAMGTNDVAATSQYVAVMKRDTAFNGFLQPQMIAAIEAWIAAARGDTIAGVNAMKRAIIALGYAPAKIGPTGPLRVHLALLQVTRPETRAEGIRRLEQMTDQDGAMLAYIAVPLAEAYLAAGRVDDARATYARFIDLWSGADPELQPRVDNVRAALARIAGERGAT